MLIHGGLQKMGIPVTNPVRCIENPAFLFPVTFKMAAAMLLVAPLSSIRIPRMIPKMMISPMDCIVFPKPVMITGTTVSRGSVMRASMMDVKRREANALNFHAAVSMTINTMLPRIKESVSKNPIHENIKIFPPLIIRGMIPTNIQSCNAVQNTLNE